VSEQRPGALRIVVGVFFVASLLLCVPVSIVVQSVTDNSLGGVAFGVLWVVAVVVAYWWLYPRSDRKAGRTARHARP